MEHQDKIILVTGASSGIGRATTLSLAKHRNKLIITGRREELLKEVSSAAQEAGSECVYFAGDATDASHADRVVEAIVRSHGQLDIAVLNVGFGPPSNTLTASREEILFCMRANYDSMINFFVPIIAQMKKQTSKCMICHMNSQASYFGIPLQGDYTASKAAARLFLETARMELRHFGLDTRRSRNQRGVPGSRPQTPDPRSGLPRPSFFLEPGVWSLESLPPCARFRAEGTIVIRDTVVLSTTCWSNSFSMS